MSNKSACLIEHLHDSTVKKLDKIYMAEQIRKAGKPRPKIIGIDEISIKKGHTYRVIVSDLENGRPIWVGGEGRKEEDLDCFFEELSKARKNGIRLAVMDMWKPFNSSVRKNIPKAQIIYDKFHIIRHLNEALDKVRRSEYHRLAGEDRTFIKGQRYTLLSRRDNLSLEGRKSLEKLLKVNKRLNVAYMLKESFIQLWDFKAEEDARLFFEKWKDSLKWQRLAPYVRFARLVEKHWDGISTFCNQVNKVSLGMVEGLNNKIRVIQRRSYGFRDEEYLKLKILASFLPPLPRLDS